MYNGYDLASGDSVTIVRPGLLWEILSFNGYYFKRPTFSNK
jgi:hypothetical protein